MQPNPPDQNSNQSMKDWFEHVPEAPSTTSTIIVEPTPPPPAPAPKPHPAKKLILLVVLLVVVIGCGAGVVFFSRLTSAKACLSRDDYHAFTGMAADTQFSPKTLFYTTSFSYHNASSTLASPASDRDNFIKKLSAFYKTLSSSTSVVITLSSNYYSEAHDTLEAAKARLAALQQALEAQGVPSAAIVVQSPQNITQEQTDELDPSSSDLQQATAYVALSSAATCRAN